jgi:hypothetical protein
LGNVFGVAEQQHEFVADYSVLRDVETLLCVF